MDGITTKRALLAGIVVLLAFIAVPAFAQEQDDAQLDERIDLSELVDDMKSSGAVGVVGGDFLSASASRGLPPSGFCEGLHIRRTPTRCPAGSWWSGRSFPKICRRKEQQQGGGISTPVPDGGAGPAEVRQLDGGEGGNCVDLIVPQQDGVIVEDGPVGSTPKFPPVVNKFSLRDFCVPCSPGTYQPGGNCERSCLPCPAGSFSSRPGQSQCRLCPAGTANPSAGSRDSDDCKRCPAGTFAPFPGSLECVACPKGTFSPRQGSSGCDLCYLAAAGSSDCPYKPDGGDYYDYKLDDDRNNNRRDDDRGNKDRDGYNGRPY